MKGKQTGTSPHRIWLLAIVAFIAVFVGHVLYLRYLTIALQKGWADNFNPSVSFWQSYMISQDYFVSFSYALSASFAVWATARFVYFRRRAAAVGAVGGVSLVTLLAAAGCFLIGCCGSPMLPIYVSLFGSKAAGRPACDCTDPEICPFPEKSSPATARQSDSTVRTDLDQKETV